MKEIQKLRGRPNGVSLVGLALGKNVELEDETAAVNNYLSYHLVQFSQKYFVGRSIQYQHWWYG